MVSVSDFFEYDLTLILLLVCIVIFGYLAWRSRTIRSFQFQISIFILIWISGELVNFLLYNGIISLSSSMGEIGYEIHLGSMIFFSVFLYVRYRYSIKRGRQLIENVEIEEYHPPIGEMANQIDELSSNEKKS